jgi:hypothetical protein
MLRVGVVLVGSESVQPYRLGLVQINPRAFRVAEPESELRDRRESTPWSFEQVSESSNLLLR